MSEHLPYEEMDQQFNGLPLPDEEASWQKMKELLDEDDDDRIIPPVLLRSCLGWGLLLLTGLIVAWFIVRPEKWWSEASKTKRTSVPVKTQKQTSKEQTVGEEGIGTTKKINNENPPAETIITGPLNNTTVKNSNQVPSQKERNPVIKSVVIDREKKNYQVFYRKKNQKSQPQNKVPGIKRNKEYPPQEEANKIPDSQIIIQKNNNNPDTSSSIINRQEVPTQIPTDTAKKSEVVHPGDSINQQNTKQPKKKFLLAAGIGEQQQIPIAGQTAVPYSHYGRKSSLSDYVPSVYLQLVKEKKWFLQGEFRYGAAQTVKEFPYNRQTEFDTFSKNVTITTMRLKKTYYHQLPLSFNYYLQPALSVGIGGIYSRFYGAITEKETTTLNTLTQATTSFKQIIPVRHFTDSFLYKTQVHVLVQADYQWKKFSFELRYTKDIQPYIKYTKPDGTVNEEKNQSLQFIIRYRLWKSGNF